jgi:hypothetical protein
LGIGLHSDAVVLFLARSAAELEAAPHAQGAVVWLAETRPPASSERRFINSGGSDPALSEGWLWVRRWADQKAGAPSVKERLEYHGVSLWWFASHWILYGESLPSFDEIYRVLNRVCGAVDELRPTGLRVLSRNPIDEMVGAAVASSRGIPCTFTRSAPARAWQRFGTCLRPWVLSQLRLVKLIIRGWLARRMAVGVRERPEFDLLYNTSSVTLNPATGEERLLQPLLDRAREGGLRAVGLHMDFQRRLGLDTLRSLSPDVLASESLVTFRMIVRAWFAAGSIRLRWLRAAPGAINSVPVRRLLGAQIRSLTATRARDSIVALEISRAAVSALRPRTAFVTDGYDMWGRALVVACREAGVRVVEVQHGAIFASHAGYLHLDGEVDPCGSFASPFSPLPNAIAVNGAAAAEALIQAGRYPPDMVRVTGSLTLEQARRRPYAIDAVRARAGAGQNDVLAAYFGVSDAIFPVDRVHLDAFLEACRRADLRCLLRPHPGDPSNPARYRAAAARSGAQAPVLNDINPWDLIGAADVVLTHNSTSALDAMAFSRPVIHLNMSGVPDMFPLVSEGRAISVASPGELIGALCELRDPAERARQVELQSRWIKRLFADIPSPSQAILDIGLEDARDT